MVVTLATFAGFQVEFERDGIPHSRDGRLDRRLSEHRAAEIGVQHRAGEIEQRPQCRAILLLKAGESLSGNMLSAWDEAPSGLQDGARVFERRANSVCGGPATVSLDKDSSSRRIQDRVNRRQIAQTYGTHCL